MSVTTLELLFKKKCYYKIRLLQNRRKCLCFNWGYLMKEISVIKCGLPLP